MPSSSPSPFVSAKDWVATNFAEPLNSIHQLLLLAQVAAAFCIALFLGALKALIVGPVAALILILGNCAVILALFPAHVAWSIYTIIKTNYINAALKLAILIALPLLLALWLVLSICGSVLVGIGYGIFTPWISTFEAFREECPAEKFRRGIVDGTWGTIKGSCTVVRDFADICYHSFPVYLKELRDSPSKSEPYSVRLQDVPSCILVGLVGLVVDLPLYTLIALIKSPFMLFKGWLRLLHDVVGREGIFLETVCVPIAGLAILFWPLIVVGSVLLAVVSSIFVGLYGSVIVYQERSFRRGVAYVVAVVAEFDEYTNDWLYLREGSFLPRPRYRKRKQASSSDMAAVPSIFKGAEPAAAGSNAAPAALLVPTLAPARSVREAIHEVKMVQVWEDMMKSCDLTGRELVDAKIITTAHLTEWLRGSGNGQADMIGIGLPSYSFLHTLLHAVKSGSRGLLLTSGIEITLQNRPQDRLIDWFFHPALVLKQQLQALNMTEEEVRYLERTILSAGGASSTSNSPKAGSSQPAVDPLRAAQIQAMQRRIVGIVRSITKFPTYRRRYRQVVKTLIAYSSCSTERNGDGAKGGFRSRSVPSTSSMEITCADALV